MTYLDDDLALGIMKRAMASPGQFDETWPGLATADLAQYVADGYSWARLEGWFSTTALDPDSLEVLPDLTRDQLVICAAYASKAILAQRLVDLQQGVHYKAGPVEYSTTGQSNVLTALLNTAKKVIDDAKQMSGPSRVLPIFGDTLAVRCGITGDLYGYYFTPGA